MRVFVRFLHVNRNRSTEEKHKIYIVMTGQLIAGYLASHSRIIIPSFGAFIKRPDGQIVFMSLLKADDGVLSRLYADAAECSETEARRQIDLYATRLNDLLASHKRAEIEGFGYVYINEAGESVFSSAKPAAHGCKEPGMRSVGPDDDADDGIRTESIAIPAPSTRTGQDKRKAIVELFDDEDGEPVPASRPVPPRQEQRAQGNAAPPPDRYAGQSYTQSRQGRQDAAIDGQPDRNGQQPRQGQPAAGGPRQRTPQSGPRPGQEQQRSGSKPVRPVQEQVSCPQRPEEGGRVNIRRPQRRKGKVDLFVIIAMAAILIAIVAMIYGMGDEHKAVKLDEELYNTSLEEGGIPIESVYMEDVE